MKRRNWMGHQRSVSRGRQALGQRIKRGQSKRKSWSFEHLENRLYFSATPLDTSVLLSSSTPEGAAAIQLQEQQWTALQASAASPTDDTTPFATLALPNDPLFASQWHLYNTGQEVGNPDFQHLFGVAGNDINVVPVWNMPRDDGGTGYTGKGVVLAVIDTGIQVGHPDLAANISPTLSFNAITGTNNPLPYLIDPFTLQPDPAAGHGTSVAGLLAAVGNNHEGGLGVAPDATIVPIVLIGPGATRQTDFFALQYALDHGVDITNNSWGLTEPDNRNIIQLTQQETQVLRDSVMFGRNGLGMINVFSSGNSGGPNFVTGFQGFGGNYDSASYNPFVNSRYVIGVTGVDHDGMYINADGTFTSYPEVGSDVLVASPTGSNVAQNVANDTGQGSGLWTTDLEGDFGFNAAPLPNGFDRDRDPLSDPNYTSRFNGTSASAPLVSGVIALMLQANPNLTFRDVQEILVRSSRTTAWYEAPDAYADGSVHGVGGSGAGAGLSAVDPTTTVPTSNSPYTPNSASSASTTSTTTTAGSGAGAGSAAPGAGLAAAEDWGDAPTGYPTTSGAENGPHHTFDDTNPNALRLGSVIDGETTGTHSPNADFDDVTPLAAPNDEDGVFIPTLFRGRTATIIVDASGPGFLNGWVDFDPVANQGWFNPAEHVFVDQPVTAGFNILTIQVPATAEVGQSFARFRLTSQIGQALTPTGPAPDGEVEDYAVNISAPIIFIGGGGGGGNEIYTTWQTNQIGPFRDVDPFFHPQTPNGPVVPPEFYPTDSSDRRFDPLANPAIVGNFPDDLPSNGFDAADGNDLGRQFGHYELMPGLFANGAGYTVSQGYGAYGEQVGYAHGVVDAELAVQMARQWNVLGQTKAPNSEKTVTTFVLQPGLNLPAAVKMPNNGMMIPGGIGGLPGFEAYYNEYLADPPAPFDPATRITWPQFKRGASYLDFDVPPNQQVNVEYVEVKITVSGPASNMDFLRLMLTSPDGTQSELNSYFADPAIGLHQVQVLSDPIRTFDPSGDLSASPFTWTFSTNRNWGETTNGAVILNPITGEPVAGPGDEPIIRNWELHVENWGTAPMGLAGLEIVFHGKDIPTPSQVVTFDPNFPGAPGLYQTLPQGGNSWDQRWLSDASGNWQIPMAQRIQGSVGIDKNGDGLFNYDRYVQEINPGRTSGDPYSADAPRADDIIRRPDFTDVNQNGLFDPGTDIPNQEDFASNVVVSLYRVNKVTHQVDVTPTAYFLTGADGNFYFDVDPTFEWVVRINDPQGRDKLDDVLTPATDMKHYSTEWRVTPDWFFAPDHDNDIANNPSGYDPFTGELFKPGEIKYGMNDANGDGVSTLGPMPFTDMGDPIPMAVKNVNFLLKAAPSLQQFTVTGNVFADLNNNGVLDGNDAPLPNITVYVDANRDGVYEDGETSVTTTSAGKYVLAVPSSVPGTFSIGVRLPGSEWQFKQPIAGVQDVALPSFPLATADFALTAPTNAFPANQPPGAESRILGVVFNDLDADGIRDLNEPGAQGVRVFIDSNKDGVWQNTEPTVFTASNGAYVFDNVTPGGDIWVDVQIDNEGTADAALALTAPTAAQGGHRSVAIGAGGTVSGITFGVENRAGDDWGDLPNQTTAADNGPHHKVVPGFQLGATNSGEVNGTPSPTSTADSSDDGVFVVGGILQPGVNTLNVTVNGVGGVLTGWMDFNNDLQFDPSEKLIWSLNGVSLGDEADLNPGSYNLQITVPASAVQRPIAARFRWGEPGLSFDGPAQIGEVEDYFFALNPFPGDYNRNGIVDQADYSLWRKQTGQNVTPFSGADGNGDGVVNQADFDIWRSNYGRTYPGAGSGSAALMAGESANSNSSPAGGGLSMDLAAATEPTVVSVSSSSLLGSFVAAAGQSTSFASTSPSVVRSSAANSDSSSSDLLLLDQTWASTDSSSFDSDHGSIYDAESHETVSTNDLALAAVLNDEWWNSL